ARGWPREQHRCGSAAGWPRPCRSPDHPALRRNNAVEPVGAGAYDRGCRGRRPPAGRWEEMVSEAAPLRHDELDPVLELDPRRALQAGDGHYAVVDIGSNSVRLVVYDQLGRAPFPRFNEKSFCALGADLDRTGELSPEASRRTIDALRRFRAIADAMGVSRIDVIATEAVRRARNGAQLAAAIEAASGLPVRVLSGEEEARFAAQGVISGLDRPTGMVGDMGGGSVEVAEIADGR